MKIEQNFLKNKKHYTAFLQLQTSQKLLDKGRYVFYWEGWGGALEGRVISKYFTNWGGSNLFVTQPGEGHSCRLVDFYLLTNTRSV